MNIRSLPVVDKNIFFRFLHQGRVSAEKSCIFGFIKFLLLRYETQSIDTVIDRTVSIPPKHPLHSRLIITMYFFSELSQQGGAGASVWNPYWAFRFLEHLSRTQTSNYFL